MFKCPLKDLHCPIPKKPRDWAVLAAAVTGCELAGWLGSIFTIQSVPGWYAALAKPPFAPPDWLFAPVWIILYFLMGISAYMVYSHGLGKHSVRSALKLFALQLALNALWSVLFFGLRSPVLGLIDIALLWLAIAATMWRFRGISRCAFWLLVPYILWVSFAALLNFYIFALNP